MLETAERRNRKSKFKNRIVDPTSATRAAIAVAISGKLGWPR
jgi:hypothetical protein